MTGCTNSTATWRPCAGHCGAVHHIVAPAANRRANDSAAAARSSATDRIARGVHRSSERSRGERPRRPSGRAPGHRRSAGRVDASAPRSHAATSSARVRRNEQHVLEHAAAQRDATDAGRRSRSWSAVSATTRATATWKPGGDRGRRGARSPRGRRRSTRTHRCRIDVRCCRREAVAHPCRVKMPRRERLQLDGRLGFVRRDVADTQAAS